MEKSKSLYIVGEIARDGQGRALGIAEVWGLDVCG